MDDMYKVECELSQRVVDYLHDTYDDKYIDIADKLGVSKYFISKIKNGQRKLSMKHFSKIRKAYDLSLPTLLLEIIEKEEVSDKMKPLHRSVKKVLESGVELEKMFEEG